MDHARSKMRPLFVKIMVYRPFSLAVHVGLKKKKKKEKSRFSVYNSSDVF